MKTLRTPNITGQAVVVGLGSVLGLALSALVHRAEGEPHDRAEAPPKPPAKLTAQGGSSLVERWSEVHPSLRHQSHLAPELIQAILQAAPRRASEIHAKPGRLARARQRIRLSVAAGATVRRGA